MITLTNATAQTITLDQFVWRDEFAAFGIVEQTERALNGAPAIEKTAVSVGRPITLFSEMEDAALVEQLLSSANTELGTVTLNVRGTNIAATWDHAQSPVEVTPHQLYCDAKPNHFTQITLRFKTV
ncbi:hypothetical protein [Pseudoalteromonas ulvae]|uniref:Uncharacterized protein n=1 Tax=Pseudoalteromonas ulvae TaxID=107327 RepID=A0A244CUJ2_PSEDV|nr:hypothetical protein [Pseudoalteromonas ulvae]OUL59268.1 hypothetical protein B1199_03085 [Pseudoalteromonas ulvae]